MSSSIDQEIDAIKTVLSALEPLAEDVRTNVLSYVLKCLGLSMPHPAGAPAPPATESTYQAPAEHTQISKAVSSGGGAHIHIKAFKEEKSPKSANEMAALVAYYLAHNAAQAERKSTINAQDLRTYFRIAEFPLPGHERYTLNNAKAAGYLESAGSGEYKLSAIGHNLVVHNLPRKSGDADTRLRARRPKAKAAKKTNKKK